MTARPPFRADHVGSLLRPAELRQAHEKALLGDLPMEELRALQDRHIGEVARLQADAGLSSITDGEFRRTSFHFDFLEKLDGVVSHMGLQAQRPGEKAPEQPKAFAPPTLSVDAKLGHPRPIEAANFKYLKSVVGKGTPKLTIPSPTMLLRAIRSGLDREAYPTLEEFYADIAKVYREEIKALGEAGCTYLQIDDTNFAYLCDSAMRDQAKARGEDPDETKHVYVRLINEALAERPADMTICVHVCRGNLQSRWAASGGYEPVADALLPDLQVDGYFLEYESERAGGFEPLRHLPKGKKRVVLGLVSSKEARIETKDEIKRRIEQATEFVDLDQLCLSPQCGFASSFKGNDVAEDVERRKLALIAEIAEEVWGTAA